MRSAAIVIVALAIAGTAEAGATFEFNMGGGVVHSRSRDTSDTDTKGGFASPDFSVGPRFGDLAITARLAVILMDKVSYVFVGPSVQWWASERIFLGGGIGLGGIDFDKAMADGTKGYQTLGVSLRAGFNLRPERRHRLTVSLEVTPGLYPHVFATGIALLGGYQYW